MLPVEVQCERCLKLLIVDAIEYEKTKGDTLGFFCSFECFGKWCEDNPKHPFVKKIREKTKSLL